MRLVGFTIEMYYDARPCERHMCMLLFAVSSTVKRILFHTPRMSQ